MCRAGTLVRRDAAGAHAPILVDARSELLDVVFTARFCCFEAFYAKKDIVSVTLSRYLSSRANSLFFERRNSAVCCEILKRSHVLELLTNFR